MSNTQATVEDLIDELTDVLEKGWHLPFAGGKSFIDSEDAKQILDEIREAIPSEVRKAKAIVADRAQIISEAQREAETRHRQRQTTSWRRRRRSSAACRRPPTTMWKICSAAQTTR